MDQLTRPSEPDSFEARVEFYRLAMTAERRREEELRRRLEKTVWW